MMWTWASSPTHFCPYAIFDSRWQPNQSLLLILHTKSVWNQNIIFDAVTIYKYQDESSISYKPSKKNLIRIFKKSYEMAPLNTFYISMMMDYELCKGNVDVPSDAQKFELYSSRFSWWGDCTGCHRSRSLRNRRRDATEQHGFKMLFDGCYRSSSSSELNINHRVDQPKKWDFKFSGFQTTNLQRIVATATLIAKQMGSNILIISFSTYLV